jgi:hypothetical protein
VCLTLASSGPSSTPALSAWAGSSASDHELGSQVGYLSIFIKIGIVPDLWS